MDSYQIRLIIPAGRQQWFDRYQRYKGMNEAEGNSDFTQAFDQSLAEVADSSKTIVPSNYDNGYKIVDQLFTTQKNSKEFTEFTNKILTIKDFLGDDLITQFKDIIEKKGKNEEWVIANSYIQDVCALTYLRRNGRRSIVNSRWLRPLVMPQQLPGYSLVSGQSLIDKSHKLVFKDLKTKIDSFPDIPYIPDIIYERLQQIDDTLKKLGLYKKELKDASWNDIRSLKRHEKKTKYPISFFLIH